MEPKKSYTLKEKEEILQEIDSFGHSNLRRVSEKLHISISTLSRILKERNHVRKAVKRSFVQARDGKGSSLHHDKKSVSGFRTVDLKAKSGFGSADQEVKSGFDVADQNSKSGFGKAGLKAKSGFGAADQKSKSVFGTADQNAKPGFGAADQKVKSGFGAVGQNAKSGFGAAPQSRYSFRRRSDNSLRTTGSQCAGNQNGIPKRRNFSLSSLSGRKNIKNDTRRISNISNKIATPQGRKGTKAVDCNTDRKRNNKTPVIKRVSGKLFKTTEKTSTGKLETPAKKRVSEKFFRSIKKGSTGKLETPAKKRVSEKFFRSIKKCSTGKLETPAKKRVSEKFFKSAKKSSTVKHETLAKKRVSGKCFNKPVKKSSNGKFETPAKKRVSEKLFSTPAEKCVTELFTAAKKCVAKKFVTPAKKCVAGTKKFLVTPGKKRGSKFPKFPENNSEDAEIYTQSTYVSKSVDMSCFSDSTVSDNTTFGSSFTDVFDDISPVKDSNYIKILSMQPKFCINKFPETNEFPVMRLSSNDYVLSQNAFEMKLNDESDLRDDKVRNSLTNILGESYIKSKLSVNSDNDDKRINFYDSRIQNKHEQHFERKSSLNSVIMDEPDLKQVRNSLTKQPHTQTYNELSCHKRSNNVASKKINNTPNDEPTELNQMHWKLEEPKKGKFASKQRPKKTALLIPSASMEEPPTNTTNFNINLKQQQPYKNDLVDFLMLLRQEVEGECVTPLWYTFAIDRLLNTELNPETKIKFKTRDFGDPQKSSSNLRYSAGDSGDPQESPSKIRYSTRDSSDPSKSPSKIRYSTGDSSEPHKSSSMIRCSTSGRSHPPPTKIRYRTGIYNDPPTSPSVIKDYTSDCTDPPTSLSENKCKIRYWSDPPTTPKIRYTTRDCSNPHNSPSKCTRQELLHAFETLQKTIRSKEGPPLWLCYALASLFRDCSAAGATDLS